MLPRGAHGSTDGAKTPESVEGAVPRLGTDRQFGAAAEISASYIRRDDDAPRRQVPAALMPGEFTGPAAGAHLSVPATGLVAVLDWGNLSNKAVS